ncbi:MAG: hypothetical protein B6I38_11920 [Anaerolineaceae bacterium 4572_5.1]|nr:MAG: hypothetical protein B6I38_11920 [Anaerolineaceae bacterium 4572_5.1]
MLHQNNQKSTVLSRLTLTLLLAALLLLGLSFGLRRGGLARAAPGPLTPLNFTENAERNAPLSDLVY